MRLYIYDDTNTYFDSCLATNEFTAFSWSKCSDFVGQSYSDLAIYILFVLSKIMRIPERELWRDVYFSEPMLTFTAIGNSFPLYLMVLLIGMFLVKHSNVNHHKVISKPPSYRSESESYPNTSDSYRHLITQSVICLFALSAVTHLLGDFPVHVSCLLYTSPSPRDRG